MTPPLDFFVPGDPKGQPRARACIRGKHAGVYDPGTANGWKHAVADAWRAVRQDPLVTAVTLRLCFYFKRPASHFGSGKNAAVLKASSPALHTGKPDCDNLAKAVLDALGDYFNDTLVESLQVSKSYGDVAHTKVVIA